MKVKVYICPTNGCGNYFGSSSSPSLENVTVGTTDGNYTPRPKEQHFKRSECPDCRARGQRVERKVVVFDLTSISLAA